MPKDSFILYRNQQEIFESLSDTQAGKLAKAIFKYVNTDEEPELDDILKIAFIPIKQQLDRNQEKWLEIKKKRSEAGKIGMAKRWEKNITNVTDDITKITNDNRRYQTITKITDNVNVNVNDNIIKENIKRKNFVIPTLEEIQEYITNKQLQVDGQQFFDYFTEGGWKDSKGNQVKNWKQKLLTWNKYSTTGVTKKGFQQYEQRQYNDLDKFYSN